MNTTFYSKSIWIFLIVLTLSFSCNKEDKDSSTIGYKKGASVEKENNSSVENENYGLVLVTFTGIDLSTQACRGGFMFEHNDMVYTTAEVVENPYLTSFMEFPKSYLIEYDKPEGACYDMPDLVRVTKIKNP